ncbi:magnesium/cobalt efflux protein [Arthrobacter sp. TPD3018]|jgi:CBS domain containing-hemolysin-like protein|uniref:hemolysin family protein n=1 Tax=Bacteria TaxID=2 RepID=UPI000D519125|nr:MULTISPECIES: hemolysin family protein [Bacteria]PVE60162.1 magnesium/cobalt efflux protein [Sphingomonas sp. TPD3009]PVE61675.1 magnesium/cobalt efflux protein [Arthrobacter sp. TPD3018]PVE85407.1 magnesium/cobalt efflux protein [Sphingomonas melonis]RTL22928.1 MAG: HlyC/CorC family transporter [Sphingomonadaceae bacterium]
MAEDRSSAGYGDSNESSIWRGLRTLIFGGGQEESLRDQLEEAIDRHEDDPGPDAKGDLTPLERQMVRNLLHFGERDAGDVGVPRADIIAIEENTTFAHLVQIFAEAGHSRLPVYRGQLDTIIGMVHIKDVFNILATGAEHPTSIAGLIREPLYVPMSRGALDLLADMRQRHVHLAIVLDEYSGTEGLVTIEDLIEEIVGEIEDEHDEAPSALLVPIDGGAWEADARAELEDAAELIDPRLGEAESDVDTLGGLAAVLAGHVPHVGECVDHPSGWKFEVLDSDERRIHRLRLHPPVAREVEDA